jgi:hypothetical protein
MAVARLLTQACDPQRLLRLAPCAINSIRFSSHVHLSPPQLEQFHSAGYVRIPNALSLQLVDELEAVFDEFTAGNVPGRQVPSLDYGDHSQGHNVARDDMRMINVNQPTYHCPSWQGNAFEQACQAWAEQLFDSNMRKDYDQLLMKLPNKPDALFAVHQDMAYWPKVRDDPLHHVPMTAQACIPVEIQCSYTHSHLLPCIDGCRGGARLSLRGSWLAHVQAVGGQSCRSQ